MIAKLLIQFTWNSNIDGQLDIDELNYLFNLFQLLILGTDL